MAETFTFTIKPITDLSDVKANVGEIQKAFSKLKLPDKIGEGLNKNIKNFFTEFEKYESKVKEGIKTSGDYRQVENSLNKINGLYSEIAKDIQTISKGDLNEVFDLDSGEFKEVGDQIKEIVRQLNNIKIDPNKVTGPIDKLKSLIKNDKVSGKEGILNNLIGHIEKGHLDEAKNALSDLEKYIKKVSLPEGQTERVVGKMTRQHSDDAKIALAQIQQVFTEAQNKGLPLEQTLTTLRQRFQDIQNSSANSLRDFAKQADDSVEATESLVGALQKAHKEDFNFDNQVKAIDRQIQSYFGLGQMLRKVGNIAREAFKTIQELDKAMTETAVVTNFSVGDMWEKLPLYTAEANKLGSTIKDVYEATTLYYQQGLNTNQSMGLAVETLKMARIAGMDAKDATDAMTAALRGFNMELNQVSAQRINDVYSELAAITASDTQEISTAMEKVASLAHNAGMELETTSAFLAQMIETTREAPENLGTALKTVVARFQEMKQDPTKLIDSEGVMLDANKVDKALKSIGVNLLNTNGEFRKLDDVFLEIASRWDTLSMGQQRYIATMAAGSRQQSRFIAMMSNYSRTMELVDAAYNSSGASQRQFEKTLESLDAKLNKLKNAWNEFTMGLMNDELLKGGIDLLTGFIDKVNEFVDFIGNIPPDPFKGITKSLTTLILTLGGLSAARKILSKGIESGVGWFKGEMTGKEAFTNLFTSSKGSTEKQAAESGQKAGSSFWKQFREVGKQVQAGVGQDLVTSITKSSVQGRKNLIAAFGSAGKDIFGVSDKGLNDYSDEELIGILKQKMGDSDTSDETRVAIEKGLKNYQRWDKVESGTLKMANGFNTAGQALMGFGNILQNTPLAPFGNAISAVGMGLINFSSILTGIVSKGLKVFAAEAWAAITPLLPYIAIIGAVATAGILLYRAITKDKREMKTLAEAAKASSDAFDNLKTSTEELKNSINDIRNSDDLFKGLVVGTTEWNLALVEANQQILDLIKKYPMLQKYMTTDVNGRMSISEAGFKAVQEEQNKKLGQAQALDILTNAEHNSKLLEQEQKKIFKDEKITNTVAVTYEFDENGASTMHTELVESYDQLSEEGQQEWDSIQTKIETESAAAREQAIRAALSASGELNNTVISLFGQNLEEVTKQFEGETNIDTIKYAYADFIGGVYDPLTKALTDASGEDVNLSDEALKQIYPQIMALLQFQDQAPQVEGAIKSLGKSFDSVFGDRQGNNFINDLLNNNLEIDFSALEKFRNMSETEIEDVLENISDEEVKAIMQSDTAQKSDLINLLKGNANNLVQAQTKSYKDVAVWYAKSVKKYNAEAASHSGKTLSKAVLEGLTASSADAINHFMDNISQSFDAVTVSTMGENLFSAILGQPSEIQASITKLINGVDWSSAIERGNFYAQYEEGSKAFKELNDQQKKFITGQKKVDKSLDLTGKQFEELVQSSDFLEILTDKWSDFADESGKVDATGIREMAKECGTLSKVLNLAEFDANNLAAALNYFQETGSFDGINSATLAAIKEFNQLDKAVQEVHDSIENFEPGANYEEGVEAYQDYASKLKENVEKGYYSTAETISYAKQLVGEDKWRELVHSTGSREGAENAIIENSPFLEETVQDTNYRILDSLAQGVDITGDKVTEQITDELTVEKLPDDTFKWDFGKMDLPELVNSFMQRLHVPEHIAKGLVTGLIGTDIGYEGDNATLDIQRNGRNNGILEYLKEIKQLNPSLGNGNTLVMSEASRDFMMNAAGYYDDPAFASKEEAIKAFYDDIINVQSDFNAKYGEELGFTIETINTFNSEADSLNEYLQAKYGKGEQNIKNGTNQLFGIDESNSIANFDEALQQMQADGIEYSQALQLAIDKAKELDWKKVLFNGKELDISEVIDMASFNEVVEEAAEMDHWEDVGTIIANTIADILHEAGIGNGSNNNDTSSEVPFNAEEFTEQVHVKIEAELNVQKEQLEHNLESAQSQVTKLEQQIEDQKEIGVDTSALEDRLAVAKQKVIAFQTELDGVNNRLNNLQNKHININIDYSTSSLPGPVKAVAYKGQNNHISTTGFYAGSAARGRYGTVGPKDKGGLTLTGEKGFEIAWLPSENRSMILGAQGPQLTDLPKDAVIYTHEQSKKIVKQKSIPAGSHSGYQKPGPNTGGAIDVNIVSDQTSGSGSGSGSGSSSNSSSSSEKDPKRTNWYKEEITRYNLNQSINKIAANIKKTTEEIDKILDKVGTKYSDIANNVTQEAKLIKQNIENQKALRDSFQSQLNLLDKGGRSLWIDIMDSAGESSQKSISTSQFVYKDKDGAYKVDKNKVLSYAASLGGDAETQKINAEAIFSAISSEVSNLTSGLINAEQAILDYEKQLEERIQKISEAFFAWENELTKIYDLTQKISNSDSQSSRLTAETAMLFARVEAGFISVSRAGEYLQRVQKDSAKLIAERIALTREDINERKKDLKSFVSSADEWSEYQKIRGQNKKLASQGKLTDKDQAREDAAYAKYEASAIMNSYVKQTRNADGTYEFDFNEEQLEKDKKAGKINEATYNAIKEGFDEMVQKNEELNEAIANAADDMAEVYETYSNHLQTMADLEAKLTDAFEQAAQREVSKLEALNTSLTNAMKNVLDQVKKNIQARRQAEDNAKTEGDIAKKQQRLATLRANTSGGNQVEIAQLEKEIGDAQNSYGRTLEDQLMANMQSQADEASKQRQEQIDLAKQQIEYNRQTGVYAAEADRLLANVQGNQSTIQNVLQSTQTETLGKWGILVEKNDIKRQVAEAMVAEDAIPALKKVITDSGNALAASISAWNGNMTKTDKKNTTKENKGTKGIDSKKDKRKNYKNKEPGKSGSGSGSGSGSSSGKTVTPGKGEWDYSSGWLATLPETNSNYFAPYQIKNLQHGLNTLKWSKLISFGADLATDGVMGPKTKTAVKALQKLVGVSQDGIWGPVTGAAVHKKYPKYAGGGLASKTGPAWLDGTPTKPELVLNAQDTKNFIALKDILSGVMRSISHTDTSNTYNSPTNFEININVDKIASDYDVDKLTERIKRNIVKDATYRNVTSVRKFR